jgi:hypothetical protein
MAMAGREAMQKNLAKDPDSLVQFLLVFTVESIVSSAQPRFSCGSDSAR